MSIIFLTLRDIKEIHTLQIKLFGGSFGVRDQNLLESAIEMPKSQFGGEYMHPSIFEMAAAYLFHISKNHAFIDGNKRTAFTSSITFLDVNGYTITASEKQLENLVLDTATGKLDKKQIASFFEKHNERN